MMRPGVTSPFNIYVELEERMYHPGDTVRGTLVLELAKKLNCDLIELRMSGDVRVFWIESAVTQTSLMQRIPYEQRKNLFKEEKVLWRAKLDEGKPRCQATIDDIVRVASSNTIKMQNTVSRNMMTCSDDFKGIDPGVHRMPFEFEIPFCGLQTSFELNDELASIRYQIEACATLNGMIQKRINHIFPVVVGRDLSEEEDILLQPRNENKTFTVKGGIIRASLTLPKRGFTPGEPINAIVNISNNSSQSIKFASVSIVRRTACIAIKPFISTKDHIYETAGSVLPLHKIERGRTTEWTANFNIPALTPSACVEDFLHIEYLAQLSIGFDRSTPKRATMKMQIPITIGTVPIGSMDGSVYVPTATLMEKTNEKSSLCPPNSPLPLQSFSSFSISSSHSSSVVAPPSYEDVVSCARTLSTVSSEAPPAYPGMNQTS